MYCKQCGKQISDTASFCRFCGARTTGKVVEEIPPVEEFYPAQMPVQEPVPAEPQQPAVEIPEPVPVEPQQPVAVIPEPAPVEPQWPVTVIPEPEPAEPQRPVMVIPEPEPTEPEPQRPVVVIPEPVSVQPQRPVAVIPEHVPEQPQWPAAEIPTPAPQDSGKQTDGQADKKYSKKVKLYMVRAGFLTALVSIFLIPCTAAFFAFVFLNILSKEISFPALGGIEKGVVNNLLGSEVTIILLGVVCLLLMLDIFFIYRKCARRAFLALGISLLIVGLVSFGMSLSATYIVNHLVAEWKSILLPQVPSFSQAGMLVSIGWCVIGAALISIFLCIRALRKKPNIVLNRRSNVFPVIILLLHIIIVLVVGAGVFLIAFDYLPF